MPDETSCYIDTLYYDKYYYGQYEKTNSLAEEEAEEQQQQQQVQQANQASQNEIVETYKGSYVNVTI